jgi:hypothetical protein
MEEADIDVSDLSGLGARGFAVGQGSAREAIQQLAAAFAFGVEGDDVLRFVPRGGAAAATLAYDELVRLLDFDRAEGDRIVLRLIDAETGTAADDPFTFIGGAAGELRATAICDEAVHRIEGDVDGDGVAELTIDVVTGATAIAGWFVL